MKKTIVSLLIGSALFTACTKEYETLPRQEVKSESCLPQTINPSGRSYDKDSVLSYSCNNKFCGLMPVSSRNYWVYLDSIYTDGVFARTQYDTLRFTESYRSVTDGLTWWNNDLEIGLPERMYINDSAIFKLEQRMFTTDILDVKKEYTLFEGDSIRYLTNFEDAAAIGRSLKLTSPVTVPAGSFNDCLYFDKNARSYRRDQVYFKPGVGVLKYIQEKTEMGYRELKTQKISTLVKFHFE